MLVEALTLGGLGALAALGLGAAAKIFYVEVDPLVAAIDEALPGANCGGCGQAGCSSAAEAIAKGLMPPTGCVGGGAEVHAAVAAVLGVEVKETEPRLAQVGCRYPVARSDVKYAYAGVTDCRAAIMLAGGPKECHVGCIGLGTCVSVCPFDALSLGADGLPVVDEYKCTGCGTCTRHCPVGIMRLTSVSDRILEELTSDVCSAPCQRTCPAGINIPLQIHLTAQGDYEGALRVVKERNPLPLICGRICPHPCEVECRRNLADEPVAINPLKRFVADVERDSGQRVQPYKAPATGRKVAVIGGGVEGLSAAYFLARLGHSPVLFEAGTKLGGLLRSAIPPSRLPREVLDWEIEGILEMGVEARTGQVFGTDFDLGTLLEEGFEAIHLATGGWDTNLMRGGMSDPSTSLPGLYLLLPLSLAWAKGDKVELGSQVAIVGAGKEGLKLAGQCLEQGAKKVTVLWRRRRDQLSLSDEELAQARDQGIDLRFNARVLSLGGLGGRLTSLSFTASPDQAEPTEILVDSVVAAGGRAPGLVIRPAAERDDEGKLADLSWESVLPYQRPGLEGRGLFANDEPVSDFRAAVEAIGAGRRAAASVHQLLEGLPVQAPDHMLGPDTDLIDVNKLFNLVQVGPRQPMPTAGDEAQMDPGVEIELGLGEKAAREEAKRCLNCGLICYQRTQYR